MKAVTSIIRVRVYLLGVKRLELRLLPGEVMRFKDSQEQQQYLKHASSRGNVELVFAGLDVLGSTPWLHVLENGFSDSYLCLNVEKLPIMVR